uniref:Type I site-specific deoxyribonuclease n=1 Tax=Rhabditophanes sp. KR3021 TaxID=114890 RepID=A0AC35TYQ2_9BILA
MGSQNLLVQLNELAMERFEKQHDFICLTKDVGRLLDDYRFNVAKIRLTNGYQASLEAQKNIVELEPVYRFNVLEGNVVEVLGGNDSGGSTKPKNSFKPFGLLENVYVRNARASIQKTLPLIAELATVRAQLLDLDQKYYLAKGLHEGDKQ